MDFSKRTLKFVFFNSIYMLLVVALFAFSYVFDNGMSVKADEVDVVTVVEEGFDNKNYSSLQTAIDSITSKGTINFLSNVNECVVIHSDDEINLNLAGFVLSCDGWATIDNYGILVVSNGKVEATSSESGQAIYSKLGKVTIKENTEIVGYVGINNTTELLVEGGVITGNVSHGIYNGDITTSSGIYSVGSVTINGGKVETKDSSNEAAAVFVAIGNVTINANVQISGSTAINNSGTLVVNGGEIAAVNTGVLNSSGTATLSDVHITVNGASSSGIYVAKGEVIINSGTIISGVTAINNRAIVKVLGGEITGTTSHGIYTSKGSVSLSGGVVKANSDSGSGVFVASGDVTLSSHIIVLGKNAVENRGVVNIIGGKIEATNYGINNVGVVNMSGGEIAAVERGINNTTNKDGMIGESVISGGKINGKTGVYVAKGIVTIKGDASITGETAIDNDTSLKIDGGLVSGTKYGIDNSGDAVITGGEIIGGSRAISNTAGTVSASGGKFGSQDGTVVYVTAGTFNLSGNAEVKGNTGIHNKGIVNVSGGIIEGTVSHSIYNNGGELNVSGGLVKVEETMTKINAIFNTLGTVVVSGNAEIEGYNAVSNRGTLNINGGKITAINNGVVNDNVLNMTQGTIVAGERGISNSAYKDKEGVIVTNGVATINGGTINGKVAVYVSLGTVNVGGSAIVRGNTAINNISVLNVTGGEITSNETHAIYNNGGTLSVSGGVITGKLDVGYAVFSVLGETTISGNANLNGYNGVYNGGTLSIEGSVINGSNYGLNNDKGIATVKSTAQINGKYAIDNKDELYIEGGEIIGIERGLSNSNGTAKISGGAVNSQNGTAVYITKGTVIINGTAEVRGNTGIHNKGIVNMSNGEVIGITSHGIYNNGGEATISGGTISTENKTESASSIFVSSGSVNISDKAQVSSYLPINNNGELIISGGNITGEYIGINNTSNIEISGGNITGGEKGISTTNGSVTISGGKVEALTGIYISSEGNVIVKGNAQISGETGINTKSSLSVSGGTIIGTVSHGIYVNGGDVDISGGVIDIVDESGKSSEIFISSGEVTVSENVLITGYEPINNKGTLIVNGGTITGTNYGVNNSGTIVMNGGVIIGNVRGITSIGDVEINGGKVEGDTGVYVSQGTLVIDGDGEIRGKTAISNVGNVVIEGGTIIGTASHAIYNNGGNLEVNGGLVNIISQDASIYAIHIKSGVANISGDAEITGINGIYNKGTLIISNCNINSKNYAIHNQGSATISGGSIQSLEGVSVYNQTNSLIISESTNDEVTVRISGKVGIENKATLTIESGEILGVEKGILNNEGEITIENAKVSIGDNVGSAIYVSVGNVTVNEGSVIEGETAINNRGSVTVNGGLIKGTSSHGIYTANGSLFVNGGTIQSNDSINSASAIFVASGESTINGDSEIFGYTGINNKGTLRVAGGNISGANYGLNNTGIAEMTDGRIVGEVRGIAISQGEVSVSGGKVEGVTGIYISSGVLTISGNAKVTGDTGINNNASTLNIFGGTIVGNASHGIYSSGIVNVNDGTIKSESSVETAAGLFILSGKATILYANISGMNGIDTKGELTIHQGNITGIKNGILSEGTTVINGGNITTLDEEELGYGLYVGIGETKVLGTTKISGINAIYNKRILTIENGKVEAIKCGINNDGGILNIKGGEIISEGHGVYSSGTLTISGGSISAGISDGSYGLFVKDGNAVVKNALISGASGAINQSVLTIETGTIKGKKNYGVLNESRLIIGIRDGITSIEDPVIISDIDTGVYNKESGTISLYDGVIKGYFNSCNGGCSSHIIDSENQFVIKEEVDEDLYYVTYLDAHLLPVAKVVIDGQEVLHNTLIEAVESVESEAEITLLRNGTNECIIINEDQSIVLDLAGYNISCRDEYAIINYGTLTILSSNGRIEGMSSSKGAIYNIGVLNIEENGAASEIQIKGENVGIYNEGVVNMYGGVVVGELSYAIVGGDLNYINGTLMANISYVKYSYNSGCLDTIGEYTIIENNYYKTQTKIEVASIGEIKFDRLKDAFEAASNDDIIVLNTDVTELMIEEIGKKITLDLNGYILNSYVKEMQFNAIDDTGYDFITVNNLGELVVTNGFIEVLNNKARGINNSGILTVDNVSLSSVGLAVVNNKNGEFHLNSGVLKSNDINIYTSANRDIYMLDDGCIELSEENGYYVASVSKETVLDRNLTSEARIVDGNVVITINQVDFVGEGNIKLYLKSNTTADYDYYEEELICDNENKVCNITVLVEDATGKIINRLAYLYHVVYENELVIKYSDDEKVDVVRTDLRIINDTSIPHISLDGGRNLLSTDGNSISIVMNSSRDSLSLNEQINVKNALFGKSNIANLISSMDLNDIVMSAFKEGECHVEGVATVCEISFEYINSIDIYDGNPVPSIEKSLVTIVLKKSVPTPVNSEIDGSKTVCEYQGVCEIPFVEFRSVGGLNVASTITTILFNGVSVNTIDTNVLGQYIVQTVGVDSQGNKSDAVVRIFEIVDTVKPIIELEDVVIVKKGHTYSDADVVAYDNYDEFVRIERLTQDVNFKKPGKYTVGYKAIDSSGNETIVYRTVIVEGESNIPLIILGAVALVLFAGISTVVILKKKKKIINK